MRNGFGLFLFFALLVSACATTNPIAEPVATPPAISVQITKDFCPSLEIRAGMQIAWTNADNADRTLWIERKDENDILIDSGGIDLLQPGTIYSVTLMDPGQYIYYCSKDHTSFGTITVSP